VLNDIDVAVEWGLMPFSILPGLLAGLRTGNPFLGFGATAVTVLMFSLFGEMCKWMVKVLYVRNFPKDLPTPVRTFYCGE